MATSTAAGLLSGCGAASGSDAAGKMTEEKVKVNYKGLFGEDEEELTMYFRDGNKQIAYYDMDTVASIMTKLYRDGYGDYEKDPDYALSYEVNNNQVTFTRENGYPMVIDFEKDTITFADYDMFTSHSYDTTTVDLAHSSGYDEKGEAVYLKRNEEGSFSRYGKEMVFDLGKYNIDLLKDGDSYYLQAQTMQDLLLTSTYTIYLYNGENAIYANYMDLMNDFRGDTGLASVYYRENPEERSQDLIDYTYNELCMVLDYEYGLKDTHKIESFDEYFQELAFEGTSLKDLFMSENPVDSEKALFYLTRIAFDDLHSGYQSASVYSGKECSADIMSLPMGASNNEFMDVMEQYGTKRGEMLGDKNGNVSAYQEVGNTAYVTFDTFMPKTEDYYVNPPKSAPEKDDTIGLLIYAHSQIKRKNSPIKNVVIDLSCNRGGAEDAVAFVCSWFLGKANIYLQNSMTQAASVSVYSCDANLDHNFDEQDTVADLNCYCLISPVSFSCGNLAPTMFDCSNDVTLIGKTSGGGSCVVLPLTTASGSFLQVSGYKVVSAMKNGSFYNADQGVDPDIPLTKIESYYDRKALTEYINSLK